MQCINSFVYEIPVRCRRYWEKYQYHIGQPITKMELLIKAFYWYPYISRSIGSEPKTGHSLNCSQNGRQLWKITVRSIFKISTQTLHQTKRINPSYNLVFSFLFYNQNSRYENYFSGGLSKKKTQNKKLDEKSNFKVMAGFRNTLERTFLRGGCIFTPQK